MASGTDEMLRWIRGRRSAARREALERRAGKLSSEEALRASLALIAFAGSACGWPAVQDDVSRREERLAREAWDRLRRRWPG